MDAVAVDQLKRAAAEAAVGEIEARMTVGLGTGSTAAHAIDALAGRVAAGLSIRAVATSLATERAARLAGIAVADFSEIGAIDLCIDGVDEIDPCLRAIKGAGGAMLREKIVAASAARMIAIADGSKHVAVLGRRPVPVEVLPFAATFVARQLSDLGGIATLRRAPSGEAYRSDQGNLIVDCAFDRIDDVSALARSLSEIPGILGHGLFLTEIDALYVATMTGVARIERPLHAPRESH